MQERVAEVPTAHGRMEAFVTHPEEDGPFPAIILYMDIWGLREELFDIARRIATAGYYCVVPDLYYRQGRVRFAFRDESGRMRSFDALDADTRRAIQAHSRLLTNAAVVEDTGALLDFLHGEPVRPGPVGAVGFCMGGRHALCAAGHFADRLRATASLHGAWLASQAPDSPHLLAEKFRGEIYCSFSETDPFAPPESIQALADALGRRDTVCYRALIHPGTQHGYALPDRDVYDKQAANRDWERIFAMFRRQLG